MSEGDILFSEHQPSVVSNSGDMENTIQDLPDEILLCIFKYISTGELSTVVAEVCQHWKRIVEYRIMRVKSLEQLESLHDGFRAVMLLQPVPQLDKASKLFGYVVELVPRLQEITISKDYPLDKCDFYTLLSLKQLKHLDVFTTWQCLDKSVAINPTITTLVVNESVWPGFMLNLGKTNKLTGYHMYGRSQYFLGKEIMMFFHLQSAHLRELTLRCFQFTDEYSAISCCIRLESLQLHKCSQLSVRGMMHMFELPKLKRLHLTGTLVRSKTFLEVIKFLPPLIEDLNLSCSFFADEYCDPLALRLPKLKYLELWRCQLSSDSLLRLVQRLNKLEVLDTDVCFDQHHISALDKHRSLKKLRCLWSEPITTNLDVTTALTVYPKEYLRGHGEGPSSELFYYWTRGINLKTFSCKDSNEVDQTM